MDRIDRCMSSMDPIIARQRSAPAFPSNCRSAGTAVSPPCIIPPIPPMCEPFAGAVTRPPNHAAPTRSTTPRTRRIRVPEIPALCVLMRRCSVVSENNCGVVRRMPSRTPISARRVPRRQRRRCWGLPPRGRRCLRMSSRACSRRRGQPCGGTRSAAEIPARGH